MPGVNQPLDGPLGVHWTAVMQSLVSAHQKIATLTSAQMLNNIVDAAGNTIEVSGANLSQTVTIGASLGTVGPPPTIAHSGVQVWTGAAGAGRVFQSGLATGTITLTAGSDTATLDSTWSGTFEVGMVIGAANVTDPSSGTPLPAINPGTTITAISGSTITLANTLRPTVDPVAESGDGLFCAAAFFLTLQSLV